MRKLTLSKNPHKGLKIFCRTCRIDNPKCKHFDRQVYRVRIHIPGNSESVRTKFLEAQNYDDAVAECVDFERNLKSTVMIKQWLHFLKPLPITVLVMRL